MATRPFAVAVALCASGVLFARPLVAPIFPEAKITQSSQIKGLSAKISYWFEEGQRVADVRVLDPRQQGEMLYLLAYLSKNTEQKAVTAQLVPRQRDVSMRLRIIYDLPVQEEHDCPTMRVGSKANWENLAKKLIYELSEYKNKTSHSSLRLSFTGQEAAARASRLF